MDLKLAPVKTGSGERIRRVVTGVIVTGDAFVASPAKKDALRKEFKADATEMEGAAVAQICWQRLVPCLIIRSLSDSAGAKAPDNERLFEKSAAQTPRCSLPVLSGVSKRNEHFSRLLGRPHRTGHQEVSAQLEVSNLHRKWSTAISKAADTISVKPVGVWAVSQVRITTGYNFGLWPQSAATLDALLCMQIKSCLPFSNSNQQLKPTDIMMSAIARKPDEELE